MKPFVIFCPQCRAERMALKHSRSRRGLPARVGVNRCLSCHALYDAPLPDGERRPPIHGVAADKTVL
jgi:hypothetical protein